MHVAVGSTNPVKVAAAEAVLDRLDPSVSPIPVDSGVAEQPRSIAETVEGAENRARRALATADASLGIGIEGGVARIDGLDGTYLIMWAAATDGRRLERGGGPSLRLPDEIASRVDAGEELGPVMDDVLGTEDVAKKEGAAGALTAGLTNRRSALEQAVAAAVGPFLAGQYDEAASDLDAGR